MMSNFQFDAPLVLLLGLLAPLVFWIDFKKAKCIRLPISSKNLFSENHVKTLRQRLEFLPALGKALAFLCFVVALARPQFVNELTQVKSEGIDIVLTIDTSLSMQALDMRWNLQQVTRLDAVKNVVEEFVKERKTDRIGMVVFGETAYTQCPLTLDYDIVTGFLHFIEAGIAGQGTAIGNGLAMSVKRLMNSQSKSRIIILLTDGRNEAGEVSPLAAAELAQKNGIKVYTIGVGSNRSEVPVLLKDQFGKLYRDVKSVGSIDVQLLQQIADVTNGKFFRAQTTEMLQDVYEQINKLEKNEVDIKRFQQYDEKFLPWLGLGVFFYLLQWFLRQTIFFRIP